MSLYNFFSHFLCCFGFESSIVKVVKCWDFRVGKTMNSFLVSKTFECFPRLFINLPRLIPKTLIRDFCNAIRDFCNAFRDFCMLSESLGTHYKSLGKHTKVSDKSLRSPRLLYKHSKTFTNLFTVHRLPQSNSRNQVYN